MDADNQRVAEKFSNLIEDNLQEFYAFLAKHTTCTQVTEHQITWIKPSNSTWPNLINCAELESVMQDSNLQQIITGIKEKKIPPIWLVGPKAQKSNLGKQIQNHGFEEVMQWCGMALQIEKLQYSNEESVNLEVEVVDNPDAMSDFIQAVTNGLLLNHQISVKYLTNLLSTGQVRFYLGKISGVPVASSLLYMSSAAPIKTVGLYLVSVSPDYRRMGIGTIMTMRPLLDAQKMGYQVAVLQATKLGESVYRHLGFAEYCTFQVFKY